MTGIDAHGDLIARVRYPGGKLTPDEATERLVGIAILILALVLTLPIPFGEM